MQGAVAVSAAGWALVAIGIIALVALILPRRTHQLWEIRVARRRMVPGDWWTPTQSPVASQVDRAPDEEPAVDAEETDPVAAGPSAVEDATAGSDERPQPVEVARAEVFGGREPIGFLLELLDDDDPETRRDAVIALAGVGEPGSVERLTLILGHDPSPEVRREAISALRGSLEQTDRA